MQIYHIRLDRMNADGSMRATNVIEAVANDPREAMGNVVREQEGWFTVELLGQSAPASRLGSEGQQSADGRGAEGQHHPRDEPEFLKSEKRSKLGYSRPRVTKPHANAEPPATADSLQRSYRY